MFHYDTNGELIQKVFWQSLATAFGVQDEASVLWRHAESRAEVLPEVPPAVAIRFVDQNALLTHVSPASNGALLDKPLTVHIERDHIIAVKLCAVGGPKRAGKK